MLNSNKKTGTMTKTDCPKTEKITKNLEKEERKHKPVKRKIQ